MRHRLSARALVATSAVILAAFPRTSVAQHAAESYAAIDGTVVDSTGKGLGGVDVVVMDSKQIVRTQSAGGYRFDSVAAGPHVLRFRRLGLQPVTATIVAAPNDVTGVDVVMQPYAYQLPTVAVQGSDGTVYRIPKIFADRMHGDGIYLTEADIARRHVVLTGDLLRGIPGLEVSSDGSAVRSTRGTNTIVGSPCSVMPVYLNNAYASGSVRSTGAQASVTDAEQASATRPSSGISPSFRGTTALDAVEPSEIVGIEIYRGPSEMPSSLPPSPCGAIVLWTK